MNEIKMQRRQFLTAVAAGAAVLPLASLVAGTAHAADAPMVSATDPTAVAVGYVDDASKTKDAAFKAGSACSKCVLFQGAAGVASGPCAIFPGKSVAAKGWCKSFSPKA
jgi:anaerobic selenocysteine-containing dehydrogenase